LGLTFGRFYESWGGLDDWVWGALGNDAAGVEGEEVAEVVLLDLVEVAGGGNAGEVVDRSQVAGEGGVVLDAAAAAFEEGMVHRIEAKEGGKEADIG